MKIARTICFVIAATCLLSFTTVYGQDKTVAPVPPPVTPVYTLPDEFTLCGEGVPLDRLDVRENLDEALIYSVYNPARVVLWIKRASRYFPYIEKRLRDKNMPDDIKYVVVQESALQAYAVSVAKAAGPWQFMNGTAKKYGLRVDSWIDERRHFERSTDAALSYLNDLHRRFGNWALAIAAYNCGENGMSRRQDEQESRLFYDTDLPSETEKYLFRIMAIKIILTNPERYGYAVPDKLRYAPLEYDEVEIDLPRETRAASSAHKTGKKSSRNGDPANETPLTDIARACGASFKTIREMNPEILQKSLPAGHFRLRIPKGTAQKFLGEFNKTNSD